MTSIRLLAFILILSLLYTKNMRLGDLTAQLKNVVTNWKFMAVMALLVVFIIAAVYTYRKYVSPKVQPQYVTNQEFTQAKEADIAEFYFFYTTWCPHCKKAKPVWESLKKQLTDKAINGKRISFIDVDCDKDTATADAFKVSGYPTFKLVNGNSVIEYDAKPDQATFMEFLNTSL